MNNKIGENIKYFREKKGLSKIDLAKMAHINSNNLSSWENGNRPVSKRTIQKISKAIGVSPEALMNRDESNVESAITGFNAWCDNIGLKEDKYHELALWLMQHLSPASRDEAMEAMKNNEDKIFTFSDCPGPESDEEKAILAAAKDRLGKSSDKNQKETG